MHPIYKKLTTIIHQAKLDNLDPLTVRILIKENLQSHLLSAIYNSSYSQRLVFYGGTALRKIYGLDRMSEDLDFEANQKINLDKLAETITNYFKKLAFTHISYTLQSGKHINRITFKFPILFDLGLSSLKSEKLHLKVEINPLPSQDKFNTEISPFMEDQLSIIVRHYTLPVLMAGKMLACLDRVFIKGCDYYDLIWYMKQNILPDKKRLKKSGYSPNKAFLLLDERVRKIKPSDLLTDLQPFFSSRSYIKSWCDNFQDFYKKYREYYQ